MSSVYAIVLHYTHKPMQPHSHFGHGVVRRFSLPRNATGNACYWSLKGTWSPEYPHPVFPNFPHPRWTCRADSDICAGLPCVRTRKVDADSVRRYIPCQSRRSVSGTFHRLARTCSDLRKHYFHHFASKALYQPYLDSDFVHDLGY
jgi:hypothetical protein